MTLYSRKRGLEGKLYSGVNRVYTVVGDDCRDNSYVINKDNAEVLARKGGLFTHDREAVNGE